MAGSLSGGNQQKLLLARVASPSAAYFVVADEPTRGIDIGAKEEILGNLRDLADDGLLILFVSSELEEVVAVSDRIQVLSAGRDARMFERRRVCIGYSQRGLLHSNQPFCLTSWKRSLKRPRKSASPSWKPTITMASVIFGAA